MMALRTIGRLQGTALLLLFLLLNGGCGFPRIIVLEDPLSAEEHTRLGSIYEAQGKDELALRHYHAAVNKDRNDAAPLLRLGDLSYRLGDLDEAERSYQRVLRLEPDHAGALNNLAWVYISQKRKLRTAEELARRAGALDHMRKPYYLDTLGVALLRQGKNDEAIAALEDAVQTIPPDQRLPLLEACKHLSEAYGSSEGPDAARSMKDHQYCGAVLK